MLHVEGDTPDMEEGDFFVWGRKVARTTGTDKDILQGRSGIKEVKECMHRAGVLKGDHEPEGREVQNLDAVQTWDSKTH